MSLVDLDPRQQPDVSSAILHHALDLGLRFKQQPDIFGKRLPAKDIRDLLLTRLPADPTSVQEVVEIFTNDVLPLCKNESSPRFLGFGDTGDDLGALAGGILAMLTQQNMINQSFDAPSATFIEIAVLRWLRELIGYANPAVTDVSTVWDVGGVITHGGTSSNTMAMMLAREAKAPDTMHNGVTDAEQFGVVVPRGIGHYSVKSALTWIGVGARAIEVATRGYRYDLDDLARTLDGHAGRIMAVVAYAGDSRTQTIDRLRAVHDLVRAADPAIHLHADACWGLVATFSERLRARVDGIDLFDSVTVDPHKVMAIPYGLSALLVRHPHALRSTASYSDLIMQEDFAFGQVTPFIGTKGWLSLKLWMMMRTRGRRGLSELAEQRITHARQFAQLLDAHPRMRPLNTPDLAAVAFIYLPQELNAGRELRQGEIDLVNEINKRVYQRMLDDGRWYLHQFSIPDDNAVLRHGAILHPLRFMANNPNLTQTHMVDVISYVDRLGAEFEAGPR
ncbi:pyridoxal phosphate-dependent decarboxylase family protein [Nocardia sp. NPDC050175]|uniref:pyridoxal phosphate-dependent decarboxylase family protein n=1 Tax=Nocardia sp. NPDC050175 TaxID=3364317 RepID=UPI0037AFE49A